jgi:hypothetical protein
MSVKAIDGSPSPGPTAPQAAAAAALSVGAKSRAPWWREFPPFHGSPGPALQGCGAGSLGRSVVVLGAPAAARLVGMVTWGRSSTRSRRSAVLIRVDREKPAIHKIEAHTKHVLATRCGHNDHTFFQDRISFETPCLCGPIKTHCLNCRLQRNEDLVPFLRAKQLSAAGRGAIGAGEKAKHDDLIFGQPIFGRSSTALLGDLRHGGANPRTPNP